MKNIFLLLIIISSSCLLSSCLRERDLIFDHDCTFVQIDENMEGLLATNEELMMERCRAESFTTALEIRDNLFGEWELAGFSNNSEFSTSQPCAYIKFRLEELIFSFNDGNINSVTRHEWDVREDITTGQFSLVVESDFVGPLDMTCFSREFMFGEGGSTYIYQRVR